MDLERSVWALVVLVGLALWRAVGGSAALAMVLLPVAAAAWQGVGLGPLTGDW